MTYDTIKFDVLTIFCNAHEIYNKKLNGFQEKHDNQKSEKVGLHDCFGAYTSSLQFRSSGKSL